MPTARPGAFLHSSEQSSSIPTLPELSSGPLIGQYQGQSSDRGKIVSYDLDECQGQGSSRLPGVATHNFGLFAERHEDAEEFVSEY